MTNPKQEYNDFIRANLPGSIRYDSIRNRYVTANGKYFVTYKEAKWYVDYLVKRGSILGYSEQAIIPKLVIDAAEAKYFQESAPVENLTDIVTHTRASGATYLDSTGTLQTAASGEIRDQAYTYVDGVLTGPYLQLESAAATNLVANSLLAGATVGVVGSGGSLPTGWSDSGTFDTVEIVSIDTYDGRPRIRIKATKDNSGGGSSVFPRIEIGTFTPAASTAYTYSLWGADGPDDSITSRAILASDGVSNFLTENFRGSTDMSFINGTATTAAGATGTQLIRIAHTVAAGTIGVSDIYVSAPQFEQGSIPTSYIPTSGSTATRAAETLTIPNPPWPATVEATGTELVTNGTFDTDTDWTKGTGWTISGGVASFSSGADANISQNGILTLGKIYQISFSVTSLTSGNLSYFVGTSGATGTVSAPGLYTKVVVASANTNLAFRSLSASGISIDNISVKEITPRGLAIAMDGLVTYADVNANEVVIFYRQVLDANNQIIARLDTRSTDTGQVDFTQGAGGTFDSVVSAFNAYSPGINVPFSIASRHGDNFINGAVGGTALTANLTPTILPALSSTPIQIGSTFNGFIDTLRIWPVDIGDTGIEEASS